MQLYDTADGLEDRQPPDEFSAPTSIKTVTQNTQPFRHKVMADVLLFCCGTHTMQKEKEKEREDHHKSHSLRDNHRLYALSHAYKQV